MAFQLVQEFNFDRVDYSYDRMGDVLDLSFGPPAPAVAVQVEDWFAIRIRLQPPSVLQGITIVGFRRIFEKVNRHIEKELPQRMKRLTRTAMEISYDDSTDALIMRLREEPSGRRKRIKKGFPHTRRSISIFEPLWRRGVADTAMEGESLRNVYVEKSLPSKDFVGIKILEFTKLGTAALQAIIGTMIDIVFEEPSAEHDENARLLTNALIQRFDWRKVATFAA